MTSQQLVPVEVVVDVVELQLQLVLKRRRAGRHRRQRRARQLHLTQTAREPAATISDAGPAYNNNNNTRLTALFRHNPGEPVSEK